MCNNRGMIASVIISCCTIEALCQTKVRKYVTGFHQNNAGIEILIIIVYSKFVTQCQIKTKKICFKLPLILCQNSDFINHLVLQNSGTVSDYDQEICFKLQLELCEKRNFNHYWLIQKSGPVPDYNQEISLKAPARTMLEYY